MDIGLYATTHGLGYRDEVNFLVRSITAEQMQPVRIAQLAERLGYHSMWFPDHVCMPMASTSAHVANASGTRAYEARLSPATHRRWRQLWYTRVRGAAYHARRRGHYGCGRR